MFTKKITAAAFVVAALASASAAHAQSVDIRVIGTITPAACVPTVGNGGVVDYGLIAASSLSPTSFNQLREQTLPLTITCDAPVQVAIRAIDNRADSKVAGVVSNLAGVSDDKANFGLGTAGQANIGGYVLRFAKGTFTADGAPVFATGSASNGDSWDASTQGVLQGGAENLQSWSDSDGGAPISFTQLNGSLSVQAVLNKGEALPLNDEIELNGLATLEIVYL
ncbi:DUF1120 domain-containing protein [Achromobacter sp. Root565]|uniref:DUF1120 domain-containing protein n=1 Tax=Achromobacter sp. Root565 TaxID=1736564 RepID=UPI0006F2A3AE|nr:DUF1120 domain-containing protein [Achromobacter sp. Root565]KRA01264.1 hypothetical protein ASD71_04015 [Achromobacter sp. Root565]